MAEEPSQVAAHILQRCDELCSAAIAAELPILAHLLSMAMLQAAKDSSPAPLDGHHRRK